MVAQGSRICLWCRDTGSIPGSGTSPGEGHGNPLQYSYLENPVDRGARWATVHRAAKSQTWLKQLSTHTHAGQRQRGDGEQEGRLRGKASQAIHGSLGRPWFTMAWSLLSVLQEMGIHQIFLSSLVMNLDFKFRKMNPENYTGVKLRVPSGTCG